MEKLVFIGGPQYSGKTTFCKLLTSYNNRYHHINFDFLADRLSSDSNLMMDMIKKHDTKLHDKLIEMEGSQGIFFEYMLSDRSFLDYYLLRSVYDTINSLKDDAIPLLDGVMTTKQARMWVYDSLRECLGKPAFEDIDKLFIYFNLPMEVSLERFENNHKNTPPIWLVEEEDMIKRTYSEQEIPTLHELPNLKILVINNLKDINSIIDNIVNNSR